MKKRDIILIASILVIAIALFLVVENGKAYLSDANCPDKLCVHQGKISMTGETITCLPNKLTVTVYGAAESLDLIS